MKNGEAVQRITNQYVYMLRRLSPDTPALENCIADIIADYKQDLIAADVPDAQLNWRLSYEYLFFEASYQASEPTELETVSQILLNHLRVEYNMRRYLNAHQSFRSSEVTVQDCYSYIDCWTLLKQFIRGGTSYSHNLYNGIKEIDDVKIDLSHNPSYKLDQTHITSIIDFMKNHFGGRRNADIHVPLEQYCSFCEFCCNYFQGSVWSITQLGRRLDKRPVQEPDWNDFIKRFSVKV